MKKKRLICLLGKNGKPGCVECSPNECRKCGWNKEVATERLRQSRREGLKKCADGYYRFGGDVKG